jgi:hypothetical protein
MLKETLRAQMIRTPNIYLWDKDLSTWDDYDRRYFNELKNGSTAVKRNPKTILHGYKKIEIGTRKKGGRALKVERIADGKIYDSITDCRFDNHISKSKIFDLLAQNLLFKRLC